MSENVLIAVISAGGVVLAAIIAGIFGLIKRSQANKPNIKQSAKGSNNIQVGIQNVVKTEEKSSK